MFSAWEHQLKASTVHLVVRSSLQDDGSDSWRRVGNPGRKGRKCEMPMASQLLSQGAFPETPVNKDSLDSIGHPIRK